MKKTEITNPSPRVRWVRGGTLFGILALVMGLLATFGQSAAAKDLPAPANTPPVISAIVNQSISEDAVLGPLAFTISDAETAPAQLQLFVTSSNTVLFPASNLVLGGSDGNRTVTLTPAAEGSGNALITVIVSDGAATAQTAFLVAVSPVDDSPTISGPDDQTAEAGRTLGPLAVILGDVDTDTATLSLGGVSSDPALLPPSAFVFGGSGANRTLSLTPDPSLTGSAVITLTVQDATSSATAVFNLTVIPRNQPPTVSAIADQQMEEDSTKSFAFVVTDLETASDDLIYTATSSGQSIVPNLNLSLGGSGQNRILSVTPAPDQYGTVIITLKVSDGEFTVTRSFSLTILPVNDPPSINGLTSQTTPEDTPIQVSLAITDTDTPLNQLSITGTSTDQQLVPNANITIKTNGNSRAVLIQPAANRFGSTVILLTVNDGTNFAVASFQLTITPVNDAPTVVPFANQRINEDTIFGPFSFSVQDVESPASAITATASAANTVLITTTNVSVAGSGIERSLTITPTENMYGASFVTIELGDGEDVSRFTFTLFVDSVNDRPQLDDLPDVSTPEDKPLTIAFKAWDVETPFSQLFYSAETSNPGLLPQGSLQFSRTSTENRLRMSPAPDMFGSAIVSVTVSDGHLTATKSFVLTVDAVNDPPTVSTPANLSTPQGITATAAFVVNDKDTPLDALIITFATSNPTLFPDGSLVLGGSGSSRSVTLNPAQGVYGSANITILVDDGTDNATSTFKASVLAPPTITPIPDQSTDEDVSLAVDFAVGDPDTDLRSLRLTGFTGNPLLVPAANITFAGTGESRTATVRPAPNLSGTARLTVTVGDGSLTASTTFTLTVRAVNDPPTIATIPAQLIDQDGTGIVTVSIADIDNDPAALVLTATSSAPELIPDDRLEFAGSGASRRLSFTAVHGRSGLATLTVKASDGAAEASISFVVTVNGAPSFAGLGDMSVAEDSSETLAFTVSDPDLDPDRLRLSALSADTQLIRNEALVLAGSGTARTLKIQPEPNQNGMTTITLFADDGRLRTAFAFRVTVLSVNDRPTISTIGNQVTDEDTTNGPVPFAIGDIDTPLAALELFGSSSNPLLLPHTSIVFGGEGTNRSISLTPAPNLYGTAAVTVTVSDGGLLASTSYTLTVLPVNDPPAIAAIAAQSTDEDTPVTVTFLVSDIDSSLADVTVSGRSSQQELVNDSGLLVAGSGAERTVIITPLPDQSGTTTITLKASDGSLTSERSFVLTVDGGNDGPTLDPIADQEMDEDTVLGVGLGLNDIDTPLAQLQVEITSGNLAIVPATGSWVEGVGAQRTLFLRPAKDRNGELNVTVHATDGEYLTSRTFRLIVHPVNDPPVAVDDRVQVMNTPSINVGVLANDQDVDRDPLQVVKVSQGVYGAISINSDNTLRYLMPPDFIGEEIIDYTVDDGHGQQSTAQLTLVVVGESGADAPVVHNISPQAFDNDRSVQIALTGLNFSGPVQVSLGPYPLLNVQVEESRRIVATVPAFLPPGQYDLIVTFPNGVTVIRRADFTVTTAGVAVTDVRPSRSAQDTPQLINIYGFNFTADAVVLLDEQPLETHFLSTRHLQAMVPSEAAPPGVYPVTVRRGDGLHATQANAFTIYTATSDDLFAYPYELWSAPVALYAGQSVLIGLRVHRQRGEQPLLDVPVAFYSGEPGTQTYLGQALVPLLQGNGDTSTQALTWTPPAPGNYTLYAVIDPDNRLAESNEDNNILRRNITVLPTAADMAAPSVESLLIRGGMVTTDKPEIEVQVQAKDGGSGVRAIFLVEYEYNQGAGRWTPVQWSGWMDYISHPTIYPWKLLPSPGARYIYAWAADNAGNISAQPAIGLINYAHPFDDKLEAGETRLYRYALQVSEQMLAFVIPGQGDPDLYIWPPDYQSRGPWVTNLPDAVDETGFVAPVAGVYQMEVTGFTPSTYRTVVEVRAGGPRSTPAPNSNLDPSKPVRSEPFVPVTLSPNTKYALPLGPISEEAAQPVSNPSDPSDPPDPRPADIRIFLPAVQR
ncbi:MAG: tandem-95 repeat protein [Caldilineaceae bacterium]|nr:tandem-95 repeat protein [Caldilineaceae bacterium]